MKDANDGSVQRCVDFESVRRGGGGVCLLWGAAGLDPRGAAALAAQLRSGARTEHVCWSVERTLCQVKLLHSVVSFETRHQETDRLLADEVSQRELDV